MKKICIADDDQDIVNAIALYCESEGYEVYKAYDGLMVLDIISQQPIDLLVIDQMMPHLNGLDTIIKLREKYQLPIIILSAKSQDIDKITGLSLGADDYVTKPFVPLELLARIKSQLRRAYQFTQTKPSNSQICIKNLCLDTEQKLVLVDGEPVHLTNIEYQLLEFLMKHANKVFSSTQLYEQIWQEEAYQSASTVSVHIRHLREKIELDPNNPQILKVIWGIGYKIES